MKYYGNVTRQELRTAGCDLSGQTVRYKGKSVGFLRGEKMCFWNNIEDDIINKIVPGKKEQKHRTKKEMAMYYFGLEKEKEK